MPISTYQSAAWKAIKGLSIIKTATTTFVAAKTAWVYNGTSWNITYPSFPVYSVAPTISGTFGYGSVLTANNGTWNSDPVTNPIGNGTTAGYTYQWTRDTVAISGQISQTYTQGSSDIGKTIGVIVTATNYRGSTSYTIAGSICLPTISTISIADTTLAAGSPPSVSVTKGKTAYTWTSSFSGSTNTSNIEVSADSGTVVYTSPQATASGTTSTSATSVTVTVKSINNNGAVKAAWTSVGASSYNISLITGITEGTSVKVANTVTSIEYTGLTIGTNYSVKVVPNYSANDTAGISSTTTTKAPVATSSTTSSSATSINVPPTVTVTATASTTLPESEETIGWSIDTNHTQASYTLTGSPAFPNGPYTGTSAVSRLLTGLTANTAYTATVTLTDSNGNAGAGTKDFTTQPKKPVIPGISLAPTSNTVVGTITINGNTGSVVVKRGTTTVATLTASGDFTESGLSNNTSYTYDATPWSNTDGTGRSGSTSSATTKTLTTATPKALGSVTASSLLSGTSLTFSASWTAPSVDSTHDAATSYDFYVQTGISSGGPWSNDYSNATPSSPGNTTSVNLSGTKTNTTHTYVRIYVAPKNSGGTAAYTSGSG